MTDDIAFNETVERLAREYEGLSNTNLARKIRHLAVAEGRCSLPRNIALMRAFRDAAVAILERRTALPKGERTNV